jgi:hypothetical protein
MQIPVMFHVEHSVSAILYVHLLPIPTWSCSAASADAEPSQILAYAWSQDGKKLALTRARMHRGSTRQRLNIEVAHVSAGVEQKIADSAAARRPAENIGLLRNAYLLQRLAIKGLYHKQCKGLPGDYLFRTTWFGASFRRVQFREQRSFDCVAAWLRMTVLWHRPA